MVPVRDRDGSGEAARIAVVIPCYNDGEFVGQALSSIQEEEPVEIVVVDDGSTDAATHAVIDQLERDGVPVIRHQRNQGLSAARMTGVNATRAPYVFPLDADDLVISGALKKMADRLDSEPAVAIAYADYLEFGDRELIRAVPERLDRYRLAYTNEYPGLCLIRRDALERTGGWSAGGNMHEDWDLWMSFAEGGYEAIHMGPNEVTHKYRVHSGRLGRRVKSELPRVYKALRERHPKLFNDLRAARRESDLSLARKLLYPVVYGGRRRFRFEPRVKNLLDRVGIWTLKR